MGQLILDDEIDYEAAREHIRQRIREYIDNWAYSCYPKEYRQSEIYRNTALSEKLVKVLNDSNDIDNFIDCLIGG